MADRLCSRRRSVLLLFGPTGTPSVPQRPASPSPGDNENNNRNNNNDKNNHNNTNIIINYNDH